MRRNGTPELESPARTQGMSALATIHMAAGFGRMATAKAAVGTPAGPHSHAAAAAAGRPRNDLKA